MTEKSAFRYPDLEKSETPRRWLIAALGIVPVALQSISYTSYRQYFSVFGIKPEEVGYDFTSLLGQQSAALLFTSALTLAGAAFLAIALAYIGPAVTALAIPTEFIPKKIKSTPPP